MLRCIYKDYHLENEIIEIRVSVAVIMVISLICVGVICGWGGWFPQASDWIKHNAILNDLIEYSWPVYYRDSVNPSMLTYNIGNYLIPALLGKIFNSFHVAEIGFFLWLEIGVLLVTINLLYTCHANTSKKQLIVFVIFIFFNGCLLLGQQVYEIFSGYSTSNIRWMLSANESYRLQYKSSITCMRWIMPQTVSIWLVMTIWWRHRNMFQDYVALMIPTMFTGILTFWGLVFMAIVCVISEMVINHKCLENIKRIASLSNFAGSATIGLVLLLYYSGNVLTVKPKEISFYFVKPDILCMICFLIADVGIYCLLIWKTQRLNGIFWGAIVLLLVLPFVHMGKYNDLQICANVPAMFAIMISVSDYCLMNKKNVVTGVLITVILFSSLYSFKELKDPIVEYALINDNVSPISLASWSDLSLERNDYKFNYFTYDVENNLFIKYLANEKWIHLWD